MSEADQRQGLDAQVVVRRGLLALDVHLEVGAGEIVAIVGENGSGKSTLLAALSGLLALDAGRITLDGTTWDDPDRNVFLPSHHRPVALMLQEGVLFPNLRVIDNVAFGARANGTPRAVAREQAASWLRKVGLGDRAAARPHELSGGQAQRVALARTLAAGARLVLLDEPLGALDPDTRVATRSELAAALANHAGPTVMVTHDQADAEALGARVVTLEAGRVVAR
jgi:molybdate transport system ATP-binding protein